MSTYIMSDIHGDISSFEKMLEKILFKRNEDHLIVNGDVLGRGKHGMQLLFMIKEMVESGCAIMIKGNHELFTQMYIEDIMSEKKLILLSGDDTVTELDQLDKEKKNEAYGFIKQLPYYAECDVRKFGKNVIVTHSGPSDEYLITGADGIIDVTGSITNAAKKDEYQLLISADIHYWGQDKREKLDKYIICGHVPTYQLGPEYTGKILESAEYIDIDAGAGHRNNGGRLACYCLENGNKYYI